AQSFVETAGGVPFNSAACGVAPLPAACDIVQVNVEYLNLASTLTDGLDMEVDYQWNWRSFGIPGNFAVRALATKVYGFENCPNVAGSVCTDYAAALGNYSTSTQYGAAIGTIPTWKTNFSEQYGDAWGSLFLAQRWFNACYLSNNNIV